MLGFAIVDRHPTATATAVWLTTHVGGTTVQHTNAVVIGADDDEYAQKLYSLTADRIVVLTPGSSVDGVFEHAVDVGTLDDLVAETTARQQHIDKAITDYMASTKKKNLVIPEYPSPPRPPIQTQTTPALRALAVANYVAAVWSGWLVTEEQRLRRTTDPRTGTAPWIMPKELAEPEVSQFPQQFGRQVKPEPLKTC